MCQDKEIGSVVPNMFTNTKQNGTKQQRELTSPSLKPQMPSASRCCLWLTQIPWLLLRATCGSCFDDLCFQKSGELEQSSAAPLLNKLPTRLASPSQDPQAAFSCSRCSFASYFLFTVATSSEFTIKIISHGSQFGTNTGSLSQSVESNTQVFTKRVLPRVVKTCSEESFLRLIMALDIT